MTYRATDREAKAIKSLLEAQNTKHLTGMLGNKLSEQTAATQFSRYGLGQLTSRQPNPAAKDPDLSWTKSHPWPADEVMKRGPKVIHPKPENDPFPRPTRITPRRVVTLEEALNSFDYDKDERNKALRPRAEVERKQERPWPDDEVMEKHPVGTDGKPFPLDWGTKTMSELPN